MQFKSRQKSRAGALAKSVLLAAVIAAGAPGSASVVAASSDESVVPALDAADISGWEAWNFSGETRYTLVQVDGRRAVMAVSESSASGYYRKLTVDLYSTPVMRWSWRVDNTYGEVDETSKAGDDSPARVYVLSTHPVLFWKTRALAYVWSSAQPEGSDWPNAYMNNERVIAVRSGNRGLGEWHQERRNVREDFKRYFGIDVRYIDVVAFMTDSDNTKQRAVTYYGDIFFTRR